MKDDAEGAETDELKEANIDMMGDMYDTESETSDKEAKNYNCAFCQKIFTEKKRMKHVEVCDLEEDNESQEEGIVQENLSCPYCQE